MSIIDAQRFSRHLFQVFRSHTQRGRDRAADLELGGANRSLRRGGLLRHGEWTKRGEERCKQYDPIHGVRLSNPPELRDDSPAMRQPFWSITSVDLITADTVSPTLSFISSALRLVITLSITLSPTRTTTWTTMSPTSISTTFPASRFRAESVICTAAYPSNAN